MRYVKISHPELGEAEVIPSAVPVWTERGWTETGEQRTNVAEQLPSQPQGQEGTTNPPAASATQSPSVQATATRKPGDVTAAAESEQR